MFPGERRGLLCGDKNGFAEDSCFAGRKGVEDEVLTTLILPPRFSSGNTDRQKGQGPSEADSMLGLSPVWGT